MRRKLLLTMTILVSAGVLSAQRGPFRPAADTPSNILDPRLEGVGIQQKLSDQLPLDLVFTDENGNKAPLRSYFGTKPVIIAPVYFECPMLCTQILNGLVSSLKAVTLVSGGDFELLAISFDPTDTPEKATKKKETYVRRFGLPGAREGWHFLVSDEASIKTLVSAMGFRYNYDPKTKQYAHASGILIATPEGKISRYLYGIEYAPRDVRLALVEASQNKIGSVIDQMLLFCYHYDPNTGKYNAVAMNFLRVIGSALVLALAGFIFISVRRERRGSL